MHMLINALLLALLALPLGADRLGADRGVEVGPACYAELDGTTLVTRVDLLGGISVEGPWQVMGRTTRAGEPASVVMYAQLAYAVEADALTGRRVRIEFPQPIQIAFEGPSQAALMEGAAKTWCATVMRAQERRTLERNAPGLRNRMLIAET